MEDTSGETLLGFLLMVLIVIGTCFLNIGATMQNRGNEGEAMDSYDYSYIYIFPVRYACNNGFTVRTW